MDLGAVKCRNQSPEEGQAYGLATRIRRSNLVFQVDGGQEAHQRLAALEGHRWASHEDSRLRSANGRRIDHYLSLEMCSPALIRPTLAMSSLLRSGATRLQHGSVGMIQSDIGCR